MNDALKRQFTERDITPEEEVMSDPQKAAEAALVDIVPMLTRKELKSATELYEVDTETAEATGKGLPMLESSKKDVIDASESPQGLFGALSEQGVDRSKHIASLMSILLPVIAGVAIGGKRGALHAFSGGAEQVLKEADEERKFERDKEILDKEIEGRKEIYAANKATAPSLESVLAEHAGKAAIDVKKTKEIEAFNAELKEKSEDRLREKEKEDWFQTVPLEARSKLIATRGTLERLEELKGRFAELGDSVAEFQAAKKVSGTKAYTAVASLRNVLGLMARLAGDTGNIALQEQLRQEQATVGNWTSSGADAAERIGVIAESLKTSYIANLEDWKLVSEQGGDALLAKARELNQESIKVPDNVKELIKKAKGLGKSKEEVLAHPKMRAVPTKVIEEIYGG